MISLSLANELDTAGNPVTMSYLLDKLNAYVRAMESQSKDKKYWKSFEKFLLEKMYNFNFEQTKVKPSWVDKFIGGIDEDKLPKGIG